MYSQAHVNPFQTKAPRGERGPGTKATHEKWEAPNPWGGTVRCKWGAWRQEQAQAEESPTDPTWDRVWRSRTWVGVPMGPRRAPPKCPGCPVGLGTPGLHI